MKHVLDRVRHLANAIITAMCGGDAAFCQIALTTCYRIIIVVICREMLVYLEGLARKA